MTGKDGVLAVQKNQDRENVILSESKKAPPRSGDILIATKTAVDKDIDGP